MKDMISTLSTTPRLHQSHCNKMDEASKQNDNLFASAVKTKMVSLPNSVDDEYNDYGMCTHVDLTLIANAVQDCVKNANNNNANNKKLSWSNLHVMFQYAKSFEDIVIDYEDIQNALVLDNASSTTTMSNNNNNENIANNNIDEHENDNGDDDDSKLMGSGDEESQSRFVSSTSTNHIPTESCLKKSTKNNTNNNNRVKFSTVQIREYAITVGDHPFCSNGIPLSLDWSYNTNNIQTLDLEEEDCTTHTYYHRHHTPVVHKMSYMERKNKLRRIMNYTESQIRHEEHQRIIQLQSELIFGNNNKSIRSDEDDEYHEENNDDDDDDIDETNGNNNNNSLLHRSTSSCTNLMDLSQNLNKFGLCSQ